MSHFRVSWSVSCLLLVLQLAIVVFSLLASHFLLYSECRSLCSFFKWKTRFVVLNVLVVFPPRETDSPHELQIACLDSSPTLKYSQMGDLFFDMAEHDRRASCSCNVRERACFYVTRKTCARTAHAVSNYLFAHAQLYIGSLYICNEFSDTDTSYCAPICRYPISRSHYRCILSFQNSGSKTAGGLDDTASQTLKGVSHFCTRVYFCSSFY